MTANIAIYPGTFDPITKGHSDVIARANRLFDKVIVAVADNLDKQPFLDLQQRLALVESVVDSMDRVEVTNFSGLLVDCAKQHQASIIIRSMRAVSDFDYELQLASMNRRLQADIETLFLPPAEEYAFISSTLVKEISQLGGDISQFVEPQVAKVLAGN